MKLPPPTAVTSFPGKCYLFDNPQECFKATQFFKLLGCVVKVREVARLAEWVIWGNNGRDPYMYILYATVDYGTPKLINLLYEAYSCRDF